MNYIAKRAIGLLLLTVMIFLSASFFRVETAKAQVQKPAVAESLSDRVSKSVIADVSKRTKIPTAKLKITRYSRQTWSNGCLGISKPDEICTQALVEGWRVVVSGNNRTWVYRSDRNGRILRLEASPNSSTSIAN